MPQLFTNKHRLVNSILLIAIVVYSTMFVTSYTHYTSLGFDVGMGNSAETYIRIRWPGNGSFWIGGGQNPGNEPTFYLDLAAAFWQQPQSPANSFWQRMGFWHIRNTNQHFLGIPSWLPLVGLLLLRRVYIHHSP